MARTASDHPRGNCQIRPTVMQTRYRRGTATNRCQMVTAMGDDFRLMNGSEHASGSAEYHVQCTRWSTLVQHFPIMAVYMAGYCTSCWTESYSYKCEWDETAQLPIRISSESAVTAVPVPGTVPDARYPIPGKIYPFGPLSHRTLFVSWMAVG